MNDRAPLLTPAAPPDYLAGLNATQLDAALHGTAPHTNAGPLLVIAGAGSGKTNTLAHRVAHLLAQGPTPARSCCSPSHVAPPTR